MSVHSTRRRLLQGFAALGLAAATRPVRPRPPAAYESLDSFCRTGSPAARRLYIPGESGYLGRLAPRGLPLTITAGAAGGTTSARVAGSLAYAARDRGRQYANPTLVLQRGERVRITLDNALAEPTIAHWHGLSVDTLNDGNGSFLVPPGGTYHYDFEVRNRAGLYWYHPHPHGRTAAQTYRGLYGLLMVEDDDERALRVALDVSPGTTEIPLVLQDRRAGTGYFRRLPTLPTASSATICSSTARNVRTSTSRRACTGSASSMLPTREPCRSRSGPPPGCRFHSC